MKNKFRYAAWLPGFLTMALCARAQVDTTHSQVDTSHYQLAIFAPLYLDSAFDENGNYRYDKGFPKFFSAGLEFYEGAQLALDSLQKEGVRLDVRIYDTRSAGLGLRQLTDSPSFQNTGLIIGEIGGTGELQEMAALALKMGVPFIDANYPNDGGITNNPDLVILNSTLRTHCEGIYRYLQRNYPTKPLVFFRKKGVQEDRLKGYFTDLDKKTAGVPLKIRYVNLDDNFDAAALASNLDSTTQSVCIAGSLDDAFAYRLCGQLAGLSRSYHTTLIGMPTWDNLDFTRPECAGEEIIYTTPFYINPADTLVKTLQQNFRTRFYSRPSDMFFRGYECTWRFAKLLLLHGKMLGGSIGEKKFKVFNDFEILPVFLNRQTMTLDYLENKKLYFIRKTDGNIVGVE